MKGELTPLGRKCVWGIIGVVFIVLASMFFIKAVKAIKARPRTPRPITRSCPNHSIFCKKCGGDGIVWGFISCKECKGTGKVQCESCGRTEESSVWYE